MKRTWQKGTALLIVGVMMISTLVALVSVPVVSADETVVISSVTWTADWDDDNMINDPAVDSVDEPLIINEVGTGAADDLIYLGDEDISIGFNIQPGVANAGPNHTFTVSMAAAASNTLITVSTNDPGEDLDAFPYSNTSWNWVDADITIGDSGVVETSYEMVCTLRNDNLSIAQTFPFWVYVSSIWHDNDGDDERDDPHEMTYLGSDFSSWDQWFVEDTNDDDEFEAGDQFEEARLRLDEEAPFTPEDPVLTITAPTDDNTGDTIPDISFASAVGMTETSTTVKMFGDESGPTDFPLRVNVQPQTPPGVTTGTAAFDFIRDDHGYDQMISEAARPVDFPVDFNFADDDAWSEQWSGYSNDRMSPYQMVVTDVIVTQGNTTRWNENIVAPYTLPTLTQPTHDEIVIFEITVENNGNHPIYNAEFYIDDGHPSGWDWLHNPSFFYTGAGNDYEDNMVYPVAFMDVGDTETFSISMIVDDDIPVGEHRYHFWYDLFYFDTGVLFNDQEFIEMSSGGAPPGEFKCPFSFYVEDPTMECSVTGMDVTDNPDDKDEITNEEIVVSLTNDEDYDFIDVVVVADFAGTPWYNPLYDPTTGAPITPNNLVEATEANSVMPLGSWGDGDEEDFTFDVDTDYTMPPDLYPFTLTITATVEDTLQPASATITVGAEVDFEGYGPRVLIEGFTADDIIPGEPFDVEFTIVNLGDDTIRDCWIEFEQEGTDEYDWDFEEDFKDQFNWEDVIDDWFEQDDSGWELGAYSWEHFPSELFYTMESLDVDNLKEIVEINLYAEGVYGNVDSILELVYIAEIAPGGNYTFTMTFLADKDMVNGKSYQIDFDLEGIDSEGDTVNMWDDVCVMSSLPGDSYNPVELDWFAAGMKALALLLFLIIVLAILMMVYNKYKPEPGEEEDEDEFGFEDEDEDEDDMVFEPKEEPETVEPTVSSAPEELIEP